MPRTISDITANPDPRAALESLEYWFDVDPETLEEMSADERRVHLSLLRMVRACLANEWETV